MSTERRPNPDELLARVKEAETRQARGKLKIFFGASAGVGKTFAMLENARSAPDEATANLALRRAEAIALADAPLLPLFHSVNVTYVRKPGVSGLVLDPLGAPRYDQVEVGDGD